MVANLAEAKSHTVTPEAFLQFSRDIGIAKREAEDANAGLARAKKAAKEGAVDLKAFKFIEQMRRLDDDEQVIVLRHIQQYSVWLEMPWGTQFSLLDAPKVPVVKGKAKAEHAAWQASEMGLKAGRAGDPAGVNPHKPGSEEHVEWATSHAVGLSERATAAKMQSTEDERPADIADATRKAARGRPRKAAEQVGFSLDNAREHLNGGSAH